jgi:hypothetical protein
MERKPSGIHEMFAQAAVQAAETDPVLKELDAALDTDVLYQQVCAKLDRLGGETTAGEVLLRVLLVKSLYDWSAQQTAEQVVVKVPAPLVVQWDHKQVRPLEPLQHRLAPLLGGYCIAE